MKKILFVLLMMPMISFAQSEELSIGEWAVSYSEKTEIASSTYYYNEDALVAAEDGQVWFVFENDMIVLEAHDTNNDGEPDAFLSLDENEEVVEVTGEGAGLFQRPEPVEFAEALAGLEGAGEAGAQADEEDLVGSLDSITIPRYHNYGFYAFVVVFLIAAIWWYKRKRDDDDE